MPVHYTDPNELHGEQADILWEMLTLNPKLVRRSALSVNQQLNTKNARIISAINEIKGLADTATKSVEDTVVYVTNIVGDAGNDEAKAKLEELGGNMIDATYELKQKVDEMLEGAELIDGGTF